MEVWRRPRTRRRFSVRKKAGPRRSAPSGSFSTGTCCERRPLSDRSDQCPRDRADGLPGYTSGQIVPGAAYRVRGLDFEAAGKLTAQMERDGRPRGDGPKVTRSIVPTNVGLQLANIAPQSFNLLTKYQMTRAAGARRAEHLCLEDQGRFAARREWRYRLSGRPEPDLPTLALALRRLRRDRGSTAHEPETLRAESVRTRPTTTPSIRARSRSSKSRPGGRSI